MMVKTTRWLLMGVLPVFAVVAGIATPAPVAPSVGRPMNVLHLGLHVSAMGRLDPHFAAGSQDRAVADMLFNGLLRYQPGNAPKIEPDLAESVPDFEMVGGRQVWTVRLRKGVLFHPGPSTPAYELTADDVVFSLAKSASPDLCAYAGEYEGLTVTAVDRYTVRIAVENPMSAILFLPKLTNYAGGFIVSQRAIEAMGYEGFKAHPVGTGPFRFDHHTPGRELDLAAHEGYFRGRPQLDGVAIRFIPAIADRETAMLSGELDVIMGSGEKGWIDAMAQRPEIVVDTFGVGEVACIYMNIHMKPLEDERVRRAIAFSLDRQAFVDTVSRQVGGKVYSPVPAQFLPGGIGREAAERIGLTYDYDLDRARALMAAAGYADGFDIELVTSEKRLYRTYYDELSRQLARIGIRCRVSVETHSDMHKMIRQTSKPMVVYVAWRPNADAFLSQFFHSDAIIVTGRHPDTNFSHYDRIDNLIEGARREISSDRQINLWEQAQIRILNDMAAYPIMYTNQCYARRIGVDYGHPLVATMALYPQITERTRMEPLP